MKKNILLWAIFMVSSLPSLTSAGFIYTASFTPAPPVQADGQALIHGCTDKNALNFDKNANYQNVACVYASTSSSSSTIPLIIPTSPTTTPVEIEQPKPCTPFFTQYQKQGSLGDEVIKIKEFLNTKEGEALSSSPQFDSLLVKAVKRFQKKYSKEVLLPWKHTKPTGYWYQSTRKKANEILGCKEGRVLLDNGVVVE